MLIDALIEKGFRVTHTNQRISDTSGYDLVLSFGYKHIITKKILDNAHIPLINLHISYLPWNKGAHPNFWSFYDSTPSGVTIHLIDEGIDTGPIIFQKYINFTEYETTFEATYKRLIREIESLLILNIHSIIAGEYSVRPQRRKGSFHKVGDLPHEFKGWDSNIIEEIHRLDQINNNQ